MTKKQKIWLAVSLAMFLVPEILWSGVILKFIYYWVLGGSVNNGLSNFSFFQLPVSMMKYIYLIELAGVLISFIFVVKFFRPKTKLLKYLILLFLMIPLLISIAYVIFAISFSNLP